MTLQASMQIVISCSGYIDMAFMQILSKWSSGVEHLTTPASMANSTMYKPLCFITAWKLYNYLCDTKSPKRSSELLYILDH